MNFKPMNFKRIVLSSLLLSLGLALSACKQDPPAATPPATETAQDQPPAQTSAADPAQADAAAKEVARVLAEAGPEPAEGTDYDVIANGQPFEPVAGKIEVVEVYSHACPACASFQPLVSAWKTKLPADVNFVYVPALFGGPYETYARAFYAAQALGVPEQAHDALYRAIYIDRQLRGNDTPQDIARFYRAYGADPTQFTETMGSFAVEGKLNRARQFAQTSGIQGTPTLIVAGKYRVTGAKNSSRAEQLRIANALIAKERAGASAPAPATPVSPGQTAPAPTPASGDAGAR